jgi:hypothetical protein
VPAFAQPAAPAAADVLGEPPSYSQRQLSEVPNAAAIRARIWSPRVDDGWVPQGAAVGGGYLWIAAYRSTDAKQNRGPCRVFRIDPADGGIAGQFALPASCGHAGGIAHTGDRYLYVGDGRTLYRIDTVAALAAGQCEPLACASIALPRSWRADALAYRDGTLWLATHAARGKGTGRIVQVSEPDVVARLAAGDGALDERAARRTLPIADQTQGAAVAADGVLWLAQSGSKFGRLQKVDAETGVVMASFAMPAGIEDLEFAPDGRLWTVSEAGSRRWSGWQTFYPVVFSVDPGVLR